MLKNHRLCVHCTLSILRWIEEDVVFENQNTIFQNRKCTRYNGYESSALNPHQKPTRQTVHPPKKRLIMRYSVHHDSAINVGSVPTHLETIMGATAATMNLRGYQNSLNSSGITPFLLVEVAR